MPSLALRLAGNFPSVHRSRIEPRSATPNRKNSGIVPAELAHRSKSPARPLGMLLEPEPEDIQSCRVTRTRRPRDEARNDRRTCISSKQSGCRRLLHSGWNGLHFSQRHADQAVFG
jgi:hypothetical protein